VLVSKMPRSLKEHDHLEKNVDSGKDRCRRWEYLWLFTLEGRTWATYVVITGPATLRTTENVDTTFTVGSSHFVHFSSAL
jgi:hypothetical protein